MITTYEIDGIDIHDGNETYYGPNQYWYNRKLKAISGCGPATAAIALAHLARNSENCADLYPYSIPFNKREFLNHMEDVRLFVKPGFGPMTDPKVFCERCVKYAKTKSVDIGYQIIDKKLNTQTVFNRVMELIDNNILPSLLILRNPHREINEYTWHWMSITGYNKDTMEISIATYGKRHCMDFTKVWNQKRPFSTDIVYFKEKRISNKE